MHHIYNFLIYLLSPLLLVRLWWRGRRYSAYRKRWAERFGVFKTPVINNSIWVHAVSYGESVAAESLIKKLQQHYPKKIIVVTTMTPTGSERMVTTFGNSIFHVYVPYDFPDAAARFLNHIHPQLAIIMETELWPNILHQCAKRNIPILLANARLSAKSLHGYRMIRRLTTTMLNCITMIAAQTQTDADRFLQLGADAKKTIVTGSIKFDFNVPTALVHEGRALRHSWDIDRPAWIAASTHPGEEEKILEVFALIRKKLPNTLLILVPRHPERFDEVATLCQEKNYQIIRRSEGKPCRIDTDIFIGDSMGELFLFYAAADVAFVGGSLVPVGGHNLLEPAAIGLATITGPHFFNSTEITLMLEKQSAITVVNNEQELADTTIALLQNEKLRNQQGAYGQEIVKQNRGALEKHLQWIERYIV